MQARSFEPDGGYAWWRLAASLAISTIGGVGLWSAVVVLPTIQAEFGVDRGGASLPYTATLVGFALGGIGMGRLADRFGIRVPLMIGAVMLGLGYVAAASAVAYWQFVLAQALLIGMLGSSSSFGPSGRRRVALVRAPARHRGGNRRQRQLSRRHHLAAAAAARVRHDRLAPDASRHRPVLRRHHAAADAAAAPPPDFATQWVRQRGLPCRCGHRCALPALQWLLVLAGLSCCIAMSMPQVHIVAYCADLGYGPARGAEMLSVMLGLGVVSRLASGLLADRIGGVGTLIVGSTLQCLALMFYLPFDGLTSLYLVSALFGLSQGGIVPSYALIVRDYFPAREAGARVSLVLTSTVLGMAIGGWLSGAIYDLTGSYAAAFLNGIAWNLVNMGIAFWLLMSRRRSGGSGQGAMLLGPITSRGRA